MPLQSSPRFVDGIGTLADRYHAFILDQWGVLHDGAAPYPGVMEVLAALKERGKAVVLLSNSGRRAGFSGERLRKMGFVPEEFAGVVTSGEATWQLMRHRRAAPWDRLGRRCLLLTIFGDKGVVEGLDLDLAQGVEDADFILASGVEPEQTLDGLRPLAEAGVAKGIPVVCSNPDLVAVSRDALTIAPGAFAKLYRELGGEVHYVGKPNRPIYQACLDALPGVDPAAIVCVGDSLEHDIAGAAGVGLDSVFVTQGIHAAEFPPEAGPTVLAERLDDLAARHGGARPTWVVSRLVW